MKINRRRTSKSKGDIALLWNDGPTHHYFKTTGPRWKLSLSIRLPRNNWYQCTCDFALAGACHQSYQQPMLNVKMHFQALFPNGASKATYRLSADRTYDMSVICRAKISGVPTYIMRNWILEKRERFFGNLFRGWMSKHHRGKSPYMPCSSPLVLLSAPYPSVASHTRVLHT
jgi:hypothetical protein